MLLLIDLPFETYRKIMLNIYDYGDMNLIIQNGLRVEDVHYLIHDKKEIAAALVKINNEMYKEKKQL